VKVGNCENPEKSAGGSRAMARGPEAPRKLLHFSKLKGLKCFYKCASDLVSKVK